MWSFWQQVEKARVKSKALWRRAEKSWKEASSCFRPISQMIPRCMSRSEYSADIDFAYGAPQDDTRLHEDRPLLKHRPSVGFTARQARDVAEVTAKRAHSLGSQLAKKSRTASGKLRRRAEIIARQIPTPTRARQRRRSGAYEASLASDDTESRGTYYEDDNSIFEIGSAESDSDCSIGSSDEEEQMWHTHPLEASPGKLNEALSTWGAPGCAGEVADKLKPLGGKVGTLNLGSPTPQVHPREGAAKSFYMGTPRDDQLYLAVGRS